MHSNRENIDLEQLPKVNVFIVPDNYFESLPQQVNRRMASGRLKSRKIRNVKRVLWGMSAAAAVVLLLWVGSPLRQEVIENEALAGVSSTEIIEYLRQQNIPHQEIVEQTVSQEKSQKMAVTLADTLLEQLDVSKEELLRQLDKENIQDLI